MGKVARTWSLALLALGLACEPAPEPELHAPFASVVLDPTPPDRPWYKMLGISTATDSWT